MDILNHVIDFLNNIFWGYVLIYGLLAVGVYFTIRLGFIQVVHFREMLRCVTGSDKSDKDGISPFQALTVSLASRVGTGNIAGVAVAITLGGPGAIFWMWMVALVGMATAYAESMLAQLYKEHGPGGMYRGGPAYYIKKGLGQGWLAAIFAVSLIIAFGLIFNAVQSNSIAEAMETAFGIPRWSIGLILTVLTGAVVLGGIRRIGAVAEKLVPAMAICYIIAVLFVLAVNFSALPGALMTIITSAFTPTAATGGFIGATVMMGIQRGVARGIFSNEAGLGTAGIAQAAGATRDPVFSGMIGMMGTFIDTIVICTMTALAIMVTGVWTSGDSGAALSAAAFESAMPGVGQEILAILLAVFAFTTILGWAFYGEKCWEFLLGSKIEKPFRILWTISVFVGTVVSLDFAWLVADTLNALMAIPNLISLLVLTPVVLMLTREYLAKHRND